MKSPLVAISLTYAVLAIFNSSLAAQDVPVSAAVGRPAGWTIGSTLAEESLGQGLPVLALDRPDWPKHRSDQAANARAWRSMKAELNATHASGWRMGALARAEAWLYASPDAVTLAALEATGSDLEAVRPYSLYARSQSWQGEGVTLGTPWWKLDAAGHWQWQAGAELLRLRQLRLNEVWGDLQYRGGGMYDFDLHGQRSNKDISSPFLPVSGASGLGASLSLALHGQPAPGWRVQLRADDLVSRLQWSNLATDVSALNSRVTSRAPDGSLDYAPLIKGQQALREVSGQIGVNWQARVAWSAFESRGQAGAMTLRAARKAEIHQSWLGWDSGDAGGSMPRWSIEFEPNRQAGKLELAWNSWQVLLATDGKGLDSQYRRLQLGWKSGF